MVNYLQSVNLDATFGALSDSVRRGIVLRLSRGEASISELAKPYDISLPAVLKHIRVLREAGLVASKKEGRVHRCRLMTAPMQDAAEWISSYRRFWEKQLDSLAEYLENTEENTPWKESKRKRIYPSRSKEASRHRGKGSSTRGRIRKS